MTALPMSNAHSNEAVPGDQLSILDTLAGQQRVEADESGEKMPLEHAKGRRDIDNELYRCKTMRASRRLRSAGWLAPIDNLVRRMRSDR